MIKQKSSTILKKDRAYKKVIKYGLRVLVKFKTFLLKYFYVGDIKRQIKVLDIKDNSSIYIDNISKSYSKRKILSSISLKIKQGESVGLLGPNGAGKTTCFYCITGQVKPSSGNIYINNLDITSLPFYERARLKISYLPQESSIFRGLNVRDNIMAVLELFEPVKDKREKRLKDLLKEFAITHLEYSSAISLSGGERRRVEIARALASDPRFILLDEPFAGVDPIAVQDIRTLVDHLKNRGLGILITDHNVRETLKIIDRAYVLFEGKILAEGNTKQLTENEMVKKHYLGKNFS
ncbi:MAG: LPS export ABC transporter ATP-binding protein [Alphaproteobacteria bacterium]|nr:LPS export ABC transporter ATP-binding protein [Alphaproteobacteria bacterium]